MDRGKRRRDMHVLCAALQSILTNTESAKGRNRKHHLWMPSRSAQVAMQTMKVITLDKMIWFWHFNPIHRNTSVERVTSSRFTISENQTKKCLFTLGYCLFHFSSSIATAFFVFIFFPFCWLISFIFKWKFTAYITHFTMSHIVFSFSLLFCALIVFDCDRM